MEKRVFKFGKSSVAVILPKKWADKRELKSNGTIFIDENEKGELMLSAKETPRAEYVKLIDRKMSPNILARFVCLYYMRGISKLVIHSKDGITEEQLRCVQERISKECPGFEIINQSSNEMQIEGFTDMKDMDLGRLLARLKSLVVEEFNETRNHDVGKVAMLEEFVDRFHKLGIRCTSIVQPKDIIKYYRAIISMEDISDGLTLIAPNINKQNVHIIEKLKLIFELSYKGFMGDQDAILDVEIMKEELKNSLKKAKTSDVNKGILQAIVKSSARIAEFGLLEKDSRFLLEENSN